jgi:uncharacterized membrane protein
MFNIDFVEIFKNLPPELSTMIIAMMPIAELRVSIPVAITVHKMSVFSAIFFSVLGDMIPIFFILTGLEKLYKFAEKRSKWGKKYLDHFFEKTKHKFEGKYAKYGAIALVFFVAIPLPFTGAWTGAAAAFLFRIPIYKSFPLIISGILISALIVTILTFLGIGIFTAI